MKPYPTILNGMALCALMLILITAPSCKKKSTKNTSGTGIQDARDSGPLKTITLPFTSGSETVTAITLVNKSSSGGAPVHVRLTRDDAAVTAAKLMPLPANAYTLASLEYDVAANGTTTVPMVINRSNLTVDTTYGIAFVIDQVSSGEISGDAKKIVVKVTLRNRWDGVYRATGTMVDRVTANNTFADHDIYLVTTSTTQVKTFPPQLGIAGILIKNINNLTFYANYGPVFQFNETSNKVTNVSNIYTSYPGNQRSAELDASGTNSWDAGSKKLTVKFWMNEPAAIAGHRSAFDVTFTYVRER